MEARGRPVLRVGEPAPDSLPPSLAFLAWLGGQPWSTWIKITLFAVIVIVVIGLAGGRAASQLISVIR
jgi:hypothetical protein